MAYEGYQILMTVYFVGALVNVVQGIANLRGKSINKKWTERVQAADMHAWQRLNAFVYFVSAALYLLLGVVSLIARATNNMMQSMVGSRVLACALGVAVLNLGVLAYARWRYASPED